MEDRFMLTAISGIVPEAAAKKLSLCPNPDEIMKNILTWILVLAFTGSLYAQSEQITIEEGYRLIPSIAYRDYQSDTINEYMKERCLLDLYYPTDKKDFPVIVWFHGGGLTGGERYIPDLFRKEGIAVAAVGYRLSPEVHSPGYIDDAAAAVAWVFRHIDEYGGNPGKIIVAGHSAGGYLTSMIGLDTTWLERYGIDANRIALLAPFSGHAITHFTIRAERGIEGTRPVIDELAPLWHVRKNAPPMLLITGDRDQEMLGRYEENAYLWRMMKEAGSTNTFLYEMKGFNHGTMVGPACMLVINYLVRHPL